VKGTYSEFVSSLAFTANRVTVLVLSTVLNAAARLYLIDLATGAAGAESVVLPNLMTEGAPTSGTASHGEVHASFPLAIASGTRIVIRTACNAGGETCTVSLTVVAAGDTPGCATFVNYGADTSDSGGTVVDPGASADTKGSYTQLAASSGAVAQVLVALFTVRGNPAAASAQWAVDVATGAAGAESVFVPDLRLGTASTNELRLNLRAAPPLLVYIAASTRISVRASCDITDATDRLLDAAVLVATAP
jgi:hypothetical protein